MKFVIPTPADFSFHETIHAHGWHQMQPFVWDKNTAILERVERLPDGRVVLLKITEQSRDTLAIETSESTNEAEIIGLAQRMLQLDLPLSAFHAYCAARPELHHIPARKQGRMLRCPTLWEDTVKVILTTNTTWTQTLAMNQRLITHFGTPLPAAPDRYSFPTPEQIAAIPFDEFAAAVRFGYRAASVHALAANIANGALDLEALQTSSLEAPALWKRLLALPGVGPYSASCLMLYIGRPIQVNVDSWARTLLAKELGRPVTDKEVHAFFADYGDWRGLVYAFYNWRSDSEANTANNK